MSVLGKTTLLLSGGGGVRINVFISDGGGGGGGLALHISCICIFPRYLPPCAVFMLSQAVAGNFPKVQPLLHSGGVDFPSTAAEPLHQEEPSPLWDASPPRPGIISANFIQGSGSTSEPAAASGSSPRGELA